MVAYLLELVQVMQKEVLIQTMKLVKYKYLFIKFKENKIKELEREIKKLKLQLTNQSVEVVKKMFYQITKNEKHAIRNKTNKNWKKDLEQRIVWGVKTLLIIVDLKK